MPASEERIAQRIDAIKEMLHKHRAKCCDTHIFLDDSLVEDIASLPGSGEGVPDRKELQRILLSNQIPMTDDARYVVAWGDKLEDALMSWATAAKPRQKVSREQVEKVLVRGLVKQQMVKPGAEAAAIFDKMLDELMALLDGEPEPQKWCAHLSFCNGMWCFGDDSDWTDADDWKLCPICGAEKPRPVAECQHIWVGSALGATSCSKCGGKPRPGSATE